MKDFIDGLFQLSGTLVKAVAIVVVVLLVLIGVIFGLAIN